MCNAIYCFSPVLLWSLVIPCNLESFVQGILALPNTLAWALLALFCLHQAHVTTITTISQHSPCLNKWGKCAEMIWGWQTNRMQSGEAGCAAWDISSSSSFLRISYCDQYQSCSWWCWQMRYVTGTIYCLWLRYEAGKTENWWCVNEIILLYKKPSLHTFCPSWHQKVNWISKTFWWYYSMTQCSLEFWIQKASFF